MSKQIAEYDPYQIDLTRVMLPPDSLHWLGADTNGRDILSRLFFGARNTLVIGLTGVTVGGLLGAMTGIVAAFYRHRFSMVRGSRRSWSICCTSSYCPRSVWLN